MFYLRKEDAEKRPSPGAERALKVLRALRLDGFESGALRWGYEKSQIVSGGYALKLANFRLRAEKEEFQISFLVFCGNGRASVSALILDSQAKIAPESDFVSKVMPLARLTVRSIVFYLQDELKSHFENVEFKFGKNVERCIFDSDS